MRVIARVVIVGLAVVAWTGLAHGQSGYDLFQQALVEERSNGQIQEAIELYRQIISEHASDRVLMAKALVQMGRAYEKLGSQEAQRAYERVVSEYADQSDMVTEARTRLSALLSASAAATPPTMAARRVWTGPSLDFSGSISPDGRHLSFPDWDTGDLAIHDLVTGEDRHVTSEGSFANDQEYNYAEVSKWSPDGTQLAYTRWFKNTYELRLTGVEGLDSRLLYRHEDVAYPYPGGWSPDGRYISLSLSRWDGTHQIGLLSVSDGSMRVLKSFGRPGGVGQGAGQVDRFSPDGQYFAYSHQPDETSQNRDIFLMAVDGSHETQLTETPADEDILGWTPDGSLLFQSNRTGRYALWTIGVENGMRSGSAVMLRSDLGHVERLGTTRDGALYYGVAPRNMDVFTAAWNPATDEVIGSPEPVDPSFLGSSGAPAWSADGKYLAYGSTRGPDNLLVIRSLPTGGERVAAREMIVRRMQWHPDGGSLFVQGRYRGRQGVFQVDIRTEGASPQFVRDAPLGTVGADGRTMYSVKQEFSEDRETLISAAITRTDLETGVGSELYRWVPGDVGMWMALSPDGREIVFRAGTAEAPVLKGVSTAGGAPRHMADLVYRGEPLRATRGFAWTPDGDNVVFFGTCCGVRQLYRVAASGGDLEPAGLATEGPEQDPDAVFNMRWPQIRPDGRQISFSARKNLGPDAVWVLENFLPATSENR